MLTFLKIQTLKHNNDPLNENIWQSARLLFKWSLFLFFFYLGLTFSIISDKISSTQAYFTIDW